MVRNQIMSRGVRDKKVLAAMAEVPRHLFVPENSRSGSYNDYPLPIGGNQTISQPYIVAYISEQLRLQGTERVLEIGAGSGYQAAVLSRIADRVYTIEILELLFRRSRRLFGRLGYGNIECTMGDGYAGLPAKAPFDRIIISAAAPRIPAPLVAQLVDGGFLLLPLGDSAGYQELVLAKKRGNRMVLSHLAGVRFVSMTGKIDKN